MENNFNFGKPIYSWLQGRVVGGLVLYFLISSVELNDPKTPVIYTFLIVFVIVCMVAERGEWNNWQRFGFGFLIYMMVYPLEPLIAVTVGILLVKTGFAFPNDAIIRFFSGIPVVLFAMRRSKFFVKKFEKSPLRNPELKTTETKQVTNEKDKSIPSTELKKACPECKAKNPLKASYCLECGFNFRNEEIQHFLLKNRILVVLVLIVLASVFGLQNFHFLDRVEKIFSGNDKAVVTTLAGSAGVTGATNGIGTVALFNGPFGVAADAFGNVYVADSGNNLIRKITSEGLVTTLAGSGSWGFNNGIGPAASFFQPVGIAIDSSDNIYVSDASNTIRKITPDGLVTTFVGSGSSGSTNGIGTAASFNEPEGIAIDSLGNLYVADAGNNLIRKITPNAVVTTLAGSAGITGSTNAIGTAALFNHPTGIAIDSLGYIYVADELNQLIRKISPEGIVMTLAGLSDVTKPANGSNEVELFNLPYGVAIDSSKNVYVTTCKNQILEITPEGTISTLAGQANVVGSINGVGKNAAFNVPYGIAVDPIGNIYVADVGNDAIRKIQ